MKMCFHVPWFWSCGLFCAMTVLLKKKKSIISHCLIRLFIVVLCGVSAVRMGSTDHCQGLAHVLCLGYVVPPERSPQPSVLLEEQQKIRGAWDVQPEKMATEPHSVSEASQSSTLVLFFSFRMKWGPLCFI